MFVNLIGRVGKDAKVINGSHGTFMTMDVAEDIYYGGENHTRWIRVRSNNPNLIDNAIFFTKGKLLLINGVMMEPTIWTDKKEQPHIQMIVAATSFTFMPIGKKKENEENNNVPAKEKDNENIPFDAPQDSTNTLPF